MAETFNNGDLTISYTVWGEGHPLVLVHGWGSNTQGNWVDTGWVQALSPHRRVIGMDCRGHGESDKPHEQVLYGYSAMATDVIALLDHLDIERADYMGYSMGAFMGVPLLADHANRFSSFVLGGIGNETQESEQMCVRIASALREPDPANITDPVGAAYRSFIAASPGNDLESLALSALEMWPQGYPLTLGGETLASSLNPVLIVNGSNDNPYIDSMHEFGAALSNAVTHVLEGKDHLTAITDPAFKTVVLDFLNTQS